MDGLSFFMCLFHVRAEGTISGSTITHSTSETSEQRWLRVGFLHVVSLPDLVLVVFMWSHCLISCWCSPCGLIV